MRSRDILILLASALALAAPARATGEVLDDLLDAEPDRAAVRVRLIAHGDSLAATDPVKAALAFGYAAQGFARDGQPDSAVACYERAFALEPVATRRLDLAAALLARLGAADAARARDLLRPIQPVTPQLPDIGHAPNQGWLAWAHYLGGRADSASVLLGPVEAWLSTQPEWRYRMACVAFEREDWVRVMMLLTPLAVRSRTADRDVMELITRAAEKLDAERRLRPMLAREIADRDQIEQQVVDDLGGRRVTFAARDGFPLAGTLIAPRAAAGTRRRGAVVLMAPGDTLPLYDSLAVGLTRMGFAVLLAELRGAGRATAPTVPSPESWHGRELQMETLAAGDVRAAAAALAREAKTDSSRYLLVGVGAAGPVAMRALALDQRIPALMLVSPVAPPVERGPLRATLATAKRPVYFQTGPEDIPSTALTEALYQAVDPRASRVADSDRPGTFATLFRRDPRIIQRFRLWLAETWPARPAPRATRPATPPRG
jgi:dienelactone hydrolase